MTEPYYQDDLVTLYLGDCREITEWTEADVLVTDPPYGIAWTRNGVGRVSHASRKAGAFRVHVYGDEFNDAGIQNDQDTKARDEALALWGGRPAFVFGSLLLPPPVGVKQTAIYVKPRDAGNMSAMGGVRRDVEEIYLCGKHKSGGGGRSAIFATNAQMVGTGHGLAATYGHPHAKPVDVMEDIIRLTSGTVSDPFSGSGSTLVAARNLGRKAIGVEIEERYCERIARRLSAQVFDFGGI